MTSLWVSRVPKPLISIIVTVYNEQDSILKCINSIVEQPYSNYELIIIDDCSNDSSVGRLKHVVREYENASIYENLENIGLGLTRNRGLELAQGEFIMFIDGDDWLQVKALNVLGSILDKHPEVDLLFMNHHLCYSDGRCIPARQNKYLFTNPGEGKLALKSRLLRVFHTAWNKLYRRAFLLESGLQFPAGSYEDLVFSYSAILQADRIEVCANALYNYRQHPDTVPGRPNNKSSDVDHDIIFRRYDALFSFLADSRNIKPYGKILYTKMLNQYSAILSERIDRDIDSKQVFFQKMREHAKQYSFAKNIYFSGKDRVNVFLIQWGLLRVLLIINTVFTKYKSLSSKWN